MPGDDKVREEFERQERLLEDREEYDLHQGPNGEFRLAPREALKVSERNGRLRKRKAVLQTQVFVGCGHRRLPPDQEAQLVARKQPRPGYCQVCEQESCGKCLRARCHTCQKHRNTCASCGRTACKKCLVITHENDECVPECIKCANQDPVPPFCPQGPAKPAKPDQDTRLPDDQPEPDDDSVTEYCRPSRSHHGSDDDKDWLLVVLIAIPVLLGLVFLAQQFWNQGRPRASHRTYEPFDNNRYRGSYSDYRDPLE